MCSESDTFLENLFGNYGGSGFIEVRLLSAGEGKSKKPMGSRFFKIGDYDAIKELIQQKHGHPVDIYFGVSPRRTAHKGSKNNVVPPSVLWADIDFKGGRTLSEIMDSLTMKNGVPIPSYCVLSGGGLHVYWLLHTVPDSPHDAEAVMRGLAKHLGGDYVHNIDRILRLPGTLNKKTSPGKPVQIINERPYRYDIKDFAEFLDYSGMSNDMATLPDSVTIDVEDIPWYVMELLEEGYEHERASDDRHIGNDGQLDKSSFDFFIAMKLLDCGVQTDDAVKVLLDEQYPIGESINNRKSNPKAYATRTIQNALRYLEV